MVHTLLLIETIIHQDDLKLKKSFIWLNLRVLSVIEQRHLQFPIKENKKPDKQHKTSINLDISPPNFTKKQAEELIQKIYLSVMD